MATEIGAGTVNVAKVVGGGVVVGPCSPSRPYFGPISAGGASQRSSWISREFVLSPKSRRFIYVAAYTENLESVSRR